jgi:hypothetical protein
MQMPEPMQLPEPTLTPFGAPSWFEFIVGIVLVVVLVAFALFHRNKSGHK